MKQGYLRQSHRSFLSKILALGMGMAMQSGHFMPLSLFTGLIWVAMDQGQIAQAVSQLDWQFDPQQSLLNLTLPPGTTPRYFLMARPMRIVVDLANTDFETAQSQIYVTGTVRQITVSQFQPGLTRIIMELSPDVVLDPAQVELRQVDDQRWAVRPLVANSEALSTPALPTDLTDPVPTATATPDALEPDNSDPLVDPLVFGQAATGDTTTGSATTGSATTETSDPPGLELTFEPSPTSTHNLEPRPDALASGFPPPEPSLPQVGECNPGDSSCVAIPVASPEVSPDPVQVWQDLEESLRQTPTRPLASAPVAVQPPVQTPAQTSRVEALPLATVPVSGAADSISVSIGTGIPNGTEMPNEVPDGVMRQDVPSAQPEQMASVPIAPSPSISATVAAPQIATPQTPTVAPPPNINPSANPEVDSPSPGNTLTVAPIDSGTSSLELAAELPPLPLQTASLQGRTVTTPIQEISAIPSVPSVVSPGISSGVANPTVNPTVAAVPLQPVPTPGVSLSNQHFANTTGHPMVAVDLTEVDFGQPLPPMDFIPEASSGATGPISATAIPATPTSATAVPQAAVVPAVPTVPVAPTVVPFNTTPTVTPTLHVRPESGTAPVLPLPVAPVVSPTPVPHSSVLPTTLPTSTLPTSTLPRYLAKDTVIKLTYPGQVPLALQPDRPWQEVLLVTEDVRDESNQVVIPAGSQVIGRFETDRRGSRFVTQAISLIAQTPTAQSNSELEAISRPIEGDRRPQRSNLALGSGAGALAGVLLGGRSVWWGGRLGGNLRLLLFSPACGYYPESGGGGASGGGLASGFGSGFL